MEFLLLFALLPLVALIGNGSGDKSDEDDTPPDEPGDEEAAGPIISGTAGDNLLTGTPGADRIEAGAGNDTVDARGGNDAVDAGEGGDRGTGGAGDDTIWGQTGDDTLLGGEGDDLVLLGDGDDTYDFEELDGDAGQEAGDDTIRGGAGDDVIFDFQGANVLYGDTGHDFLAALDYDEDPDQEDQLFGGYGRDTLAADGGDTLTGGAGNDLFLPVAHMPGQAATVIADFTDGDRISIGWVSAGMGEATDAEIALQPGDEETLVYVRDQLVAVVRGPGVLTPSQITFTTA